MVNAVADDIMRGEDHFLSEEKADLVGTVLFGEEAFQPLGGDIHLDVLRIISPSALYRWPLYQHLSQRSGTGSLQPCEDLEALLENDCHCICLSPVKQPTIQTSACCNRVWTGSAPLKRMDKVLPGLRVAEELRYPR